jgi:hypothetical protein
MRRFYRSKWGGSLVLAMASIACHRAPRITTRAVTMNVVCAPGGLTLDGNAYAFYYGVGDFEPTTSPVGARVVGTSAGATLVEIDPASRALFIDAMESDREWWGVGNIAAQGNVDVLVLPALTSCGLPSLSSNPSGAVLGATGAQQVLVVGGASTTSVAHLDTGQVTAAQPDLRTPRLHESITAFGAGALVAGGVDAQTPGLVLADAEVYDPSIGGFDQQNPILLSEARSDHGAVVLATGETLLVGGIGADGATLLTSMEVVDPVTRTVRVQNVAGLTYARLGADVLLLASGDILVAGGVDANGAPVTTMELFSSNAQSELATWTEPVVGGARAYSALPSGGALFVVAPSAGEGMTDGAMLQNTWLIDPDGTFEAAAPIQGTLTNPMLFGGAGGAPALWTGDRWLRWQPWSGSFGALGSLDDVAVQVTNAAISPDSGLAMWLDASSGPDPTLTALRFDTRSQYSTLDEPLLVGDTSNTAPDRLVVPDVIAFDAALGLTLSPGATVFVTDRTYVDVVVDLDMPTGATTLVVLRDELGRELVVGGQACPGPPAAGAATSLRVERNGTEVLWSVPSGPSGTCPEGVEQDARLSLGVRGAIGMLPTTVRNLRVTRTGTP